MTIKIFTKETALEYRQKAAALGGDLQDVGDRRALRMELQKKYGLSELEAINILNGYNVNDIIKLSTERMNENVQES